MSHAIRQSAIDAREQRTKRLLAHTRYRVHDTQRSVAPELRRNSAINPRYWIVDAASDESHVDAFTSSGTAQHICTDMNREHRVLRTRALAIASETGASIIDAYGRAQHELAHNLIPNNS